MRGELVRNALAFVGTLPFALLPRRARFRAVLTASRLLTPLAGPLLRRWYGNVAGGSADETARVLFRAMARMDYAFDTEFTADFTEDVAAAVDRGSAIFVTAHFAMNAVFTRWIVERGQVPAIVHRGHARSPIVWGSRVRAQLIYPDANALIGIRGALLEGRIVLLAIDRAGDGVRLRSFESRFGTTTIGTAVFALAEAMKVPLFFLGARATRGGLPVVTVRRIAYEPAAYIEEFRRHTEAMLP